MKGRKQRNIEDPWWKRYTEKLSRKDLRKVDQLFKRHWKHSEHEPIDKLKTNEFTKAMARIEESVS